jgi:prepilin-type processing-associated H-X9-DG protein
LDIPTRDDLVAHYGLTRKSCYCASNPQQNQDYLWNCTACGSSVAVLGYWMLIQRVDANFQPVTTWGGTFVNYGPSDPPYKFVYDLVNSSDPNRKLQVLLACGVLSDTKGNFTSIQGAFTHQSAHLAGSAPMGSNVCYTDGHVEWVDGPQLKRRYEPGGAYPNCYHWW